MKLFIPTTTLNIDNILSTECIAPLAFYKGREYGYNQFYKIDCMPYSNVQLCFSKVPHFEINDIEHHSFPLVLEVTISDNNGNLNKLKTLMVSKCIRPMILCALRLITLEYYSIIQQL